MLDQKGRVAYIRAGKAKATEKCEANSAALPSRQPGKKENESLKTERICMLWPWEGWEALWMYGASKKPLRRKRDQGLPGKPQKKRLENKNSRP